MHKGILAHAEPQPKPVEVKNGDWPECEDFRLLMQRYRNAQPVTRGEIVMAYESIKTWLRKHRYD